MTRFMLGTRDDPVRDGGCSAGWWSKVSLLRCPRLPTEVAIFAIEGWISQLCVESDEDDVPIAVRYRLIPAGHLSQE